jgi:hypothetical protein
MRKPNYRFERAERDRAKKAKNDKKLQRQQERAVTRADVGTPEPTAENEPRETWSTPACIAFFQTRDRTGPLVLDHQGLSAENNAGLSISLTWGYAGDAIPDLDGDAW